MEERDTRPKEEGSLPEQPRLLVAGKGGSKAVRVGGDVQHTSFGRQIPAICTYASQGAGGEDTSEVAT